MTRQEQYLEEYNERWQKRIVNTALGTLIPEQGAPPITCSIGMAVFPHATVDYAELYQYADASLYRRKETGRNGVTVYQKNEVAK